MNEAFFGDGPTWLHSRLASTRHTRRYPEPLRLARPRSGFKSAACAPGDRIKPETSIQFGGPALLRLQVNRPAVLIGFMQHALGQNGADLLSLSPAQKNIRDSVAAWDATG